ncbi:HTH-type transcriptional regulator/antitoxin HigA [Algoriphagus ratkowskyi]|uniref:Transcriptional regulator n=1 Tax=Algoriphagus ratkowskyi TaxID=57028 RepID=A0A2W7R5S4_9BACT|nr:transcriptional regulator [Algoriphagus ratkowskyi]PZX54526.1 HTH-type transcriptional regulator/antitoxin HigA [Algoriphagus ratkowskyi]TXD76846.1 transcriptional regulator [Algoriphagus ratkowskyi]
MTLKLIKSEKEYQSALERLDQLFNAKIGTEESDEADVLALLIDEYEKNNFPIEAPDPIETIEIRMEEMDLKQKDLIGIIGGKSRVSEVLNRKKKLTVEMVRNLALHLNLSAQILINDYTLVE